MRGRHFLAMVPLIALAQPAQVQFDLDLLNPRFSNASWQPSPNIDERPVGMPVDTIVLHHTACDLDATIRHFSNANSKVSAHFTIGRDGGIVQHVSAWHRAWHAGPSLDAEGREKVNDFSIGIELENAGNGRDPYPEAQIASLHQLVRAIQFNLPIRQIVSHGSVAMPRGRKSDPRGFPWESLSDLGVELRP